MPPTDHILAALLAVEQEILRRIPGDPSGCDNQGTIVNRAHVAQYLLNHRALVVDLVRLANRWSPGPRVGEVGAGYGATLLTLQRTSKFVLSGFELPANTAHYCGALLDVGVPVMPFDLYDDPSGVSKEPLDTLILAQVVEHLYCNLDDLIPRLEPLVRRGGRVIVTTPNIARMGNILRLLCGTNIVEPHHSPVVRHAGRCIDSRAHPREYTLEEIRAAFARAGWMVLASRTVSRWVPARSAAINTVACALTPISPLPVGDTIVVIAERLGEQNRRVGLK